jgi:hypothetical protein
MPEVVFAGGGGVSIYRFSDPLGVATPSAGGHATTKDYVDAIAAGINPGKIRAPVRLATQAALPANARVGNVLTASANGALAVDGTTPAVGDRILVKDEATGANNGIYVVTALGSGAAKWVLTRAADADASAEVDEGTNVLVEEGSTNNATGWLQTAAAPVLNTDPLVWAKFRDERIAAGTGLTRTGDTLAADFGSGAGKVTEGNDSRLSDTRTPTDGSVTAAKVAAALKPSGSAAAGDEALRALGASAATAAAGNDSRLSDTRTPTDASVTAAKVAASLKPSGSAAAGDEALRALGTSGSTAAAGNDGRLGLTATYRTKVSVRIGAIGSGVGAGTYLFAPAVIRALAAASSGEATFKLDPADLATISGLSKFVRIRATVETNAVAPAINFVFHLYPVATWGGASGAQPTVATVGASAGNAAINTPGAGAPTSADSADIAYPTAGEFVLACVTSGTTAANSSCLLRVELQERYA